MGVGQTTSGVKHELMLDVGGGTLDELVVIPQPDIVKNEVSQFVLTCRLPITWDVVQSTVLDTQGGRLLVGVIVGLAETPHPSIEKKDVTQSVGLCLLTIASGQDTVLVMQGGRLLGVTMIVGVGEVDGRQPSAVR